jgi:glycosyltransferase involved in cell wall biosynthesis
MSEPHHPIRVLYSFPHKIGADRICRIAWYQAAEVASAGAKVSLHPGAVRRSLPQGLTVKPTLARGPVRIPYRVLGRLRAFSLHDKIVANRLSKLAAEIDVVHTWPLGAQQTLEVARSLGIPSVLERPNAHTRLAYGVVERECRRLGVALPPDHEHAYNESILAHEEDEYRLADYLLCPSDFVARTFVDEGYSPERLLRHMYGYDPDIFYPPSQRPLSRGLSVIFVGAAAVRKGLHFALDAWLNSPASTKGKFLIAGEFLPDYQERLSELLDHPSIEVLGHRKDVPDLMRASDVLVLPSIEEGSALVCAEAMACGCVPLVSDVASGHTRHLENALVHHVGDVDTLSQHMTMLHDDRVELERLRDGALESAKEATWEKAGVSLLNAYQQASGQGHTSLPGRAPIEELA